MTAHPLENPRMFFRDGVQIGQGFHVGEEAGVDVLVPLKIEVDHPEGLNFADRSGRHVSAEVVG